MMEGRLTPDVPVEPALKRKSILSLEYNTDNMYDFSTLQTLFNE